MKKPTKMQYFFASQWLERIWFLAVPVFFAYGIGKTCLTFLNPTGSLWDLVQFVFYIIIAFLLGFFTSLISGWLIFGSINYGRELKNGGPFKVGDTVRILAGVHKDRITRIYSAWQGNSVRVELSDKEKETFKDIFSPVELLKEDIE